MGRRKKELPSVHRETIADAAQTLFVQKGIADTSMDEVAKAAGYSKATLYVYFENKEEIVGLLVLQSMKKLYGYIVSALETQNGSKARYQHICRALLRYKEEFPYYFNVVIDKINVDFENIEYLPEEKETYEVGERINEKMEEYIKAGIAAGELRPDIEVKPTIFSFWGMLVGLIQMAETKEFYFSQVMQLPKNDFLEYGFEMLYRAVARKETI